MADAAEDRNPIVFFDVTLGGTCRFLQVVWDSPRALHYASLLGLALDTRSPLSASLSCVADRVTDVSC